MMSNVNLLSIIAIVSSVLVVNILCQEVEVVTSSSGGEAAEQKEEDEDAYDEFYNFNVSEPESNLGPRMDNNATENLPGPMSVGNTPIAGLNKIDREHEENFDIPITTAARPYRPTSTARQSTVRPITILPKIVNKPGKIPSAIDTRKIAAAKRRTTVKPRIIAPPGRPTVRSFRPTWTRAPMKITVAPALKPTATTGKTSAPVVAPYRPSKYPNEAPPHRPPVVQAEKKTGAKKTSSFTSNKAKPNKPKSKLKTPRAYLHRSKLFKAGMRGIRYFRNPSIIRTKSGHLLAFAEGRKSGPWAHGDVSILYRKSSNNGKSWTPPMFLVRSDGHTSGSPTAVADFETGAVSVLFVRSLGTANEATIRSGKSPRRSVWLISTRDNGKIWTSPKEITNSVSKPHWAWYVTGPGHGIQLKNGRLVVPCYHGSNKKKLGARKQADRAHVIFSDDGGATWALGGSSKAGTGESTVWQLADGRVVLNSRQLIGKRRRFLAYSVNGGQNFKKGQHHKQLKEPKFGSPGSSLNIVSGKYKALLFVNYFNNRLLLRVSSNDGKSWAHWKKIAQGTFPRSDIVNTKSGLLGVAYETKNGSVELARFNVEWLNQKNGKRG